MLIQENFSLKKINTFSIDVSAKEFAIFSNVNELETLLEISKKPHLVIGGGSNILFTKNFNGLVLKNEIGGIKIIKEEDDYVYIKAGAGVGWHEFVIYCIEKNFAGAENLSLIPGSVGASPMQNIGAYGVELKDIFYELEAYDTEGKKIVIFSRSDCEFGYRESIFKTKYRGKFIITAVTFVLNNKPVYNTSYGAIEIELERMGVQSISIKAISDAIINIRQSKLPDPRVIGNAGSFFKNPTVSNLQFNLLKKDFPLIIGYPVGDSETKLAAGWLIEKCGWKGFRKGDAGCHNKQALVLVNYGNATGLEILLLSKEIIDSVKLMFNVNLQIEVNIV